MPFYSDFLQTFFRDISSIPSTNANQKFLELELKRHLLETRGCSFQHMFVCGFYSVGWFLFV